jgi:spore germination protein GerM
MSRRHVVPGRGTMTRALSCVMATALAAVGCSVAPDDTPRDIDSGAVVTSQDSSNVGQAAAGSGRIYLLAPEVSGQSARLQWVARDIDDDVDAVMAALVAGPNTTEFVDRFRSGLPPDMQILRITRRSRGLVELDVDESIATLRGDELILALAQIVYTLNDVDGVTGVTIKVDGAAARWPAGNGELQSDPLTVYDYPGLEPSTQPAYPAVPSGD